MALRIPFNIDRIIRNIGTRLRDETAPLVSYLESRAVAGCMAQDIVRTLETATDSLVSARFFATHQNLDMPLAPWLAGWIKKGNFYSPKTIYYLPFLICITIINNFTLIKGLFLY